MCLKCDGYSEEEIARGRELIIATHGWMVQGVVPDGHGQPNGGFAYTVGVTESYGLPELVIMDMQHEGAHPILNWAVEFLRDGGSFDGLDAEGLRWSAVHDVHLDSGLFGS